MTRFPDDPVHEDPHRTAPLARTALACIAVYTIAAVLGWVLIGVLAAWVLL
jgi:hypothetical protein